MDAKAVSDSINELLGTIDHADLSNTEYCEALEELIDKAQTSLDAKRAEMDKEDDDEDEENEGIL